MSNTPFENRGMVSMNQGNPLGFFRLPRRNQLFRRASRVKKQVIAAATIIVAKARSRTTRSLGSLFRRTRQANTKMGWIQNPGISRKEV
jgi:hypothetical protein